MFETRLRLLKKGRRKNQGTHSGLNLARMLHGGYLERDVKVYTQEINERKEKKKERTKKGRQSVVFTLKNGSNRR